MSEEPRVILQDMPTTVRAFCYHDDESGCTGETVMMAPAQGFYSTPGLGKNQVRMAYVLEINSLKRALMVLEKALEAYGSRG